MVGCQAFTPKFPNFLTVEDNHRRYPKRNAKELFGSVDRILEYSSFRTSECQICFKRVTMSFYVYLRCY